MTLAPHTSQTPGDMAGTTYSTLHIGPQLRDARERIRPWRSQGKCARQLGIDPTIWSLWELGKRPVPARHIPAITRILGCTLQDLGVSLAASPPPLPPPPPPARVRRRVLGSLDAEIAAALAYWRTHPESGPPRSQVYGLALSGATVGCY